MKILSFAASLRRESLNQKLVGCAEKFLEGAGITVDRARFADFDLPLYNGDLDKPNAQPPGILAFAKRLQNNDALIISSPEYNFSVPGTLKNLVDWGSRLKPVPWDGCKIFLLSASPSMVGGNRGLWALRVPLEACGAFVFPDMFSLAKANEAFNASGDIADAATRERLQKTLLEFVDFLKKVTA